MSLTLKAICLGRHAYVDADYEIAIHLDPDNANEPQLSTTLSPEEYEVLFNVLSRMVKSPLTIH